ncbi:MAG: RluA family pseudouridine synthase [Oscillospiraceae bacterium]|nr:RluA family pseudouridine synthase [Oscillospiraceae bacterium]
MEFVYQDPYLVVCVKPPRVLSTDEPGGMPELVRQALGDPGANVRTVHRLDRVVSGLMVLARTRHCASDLSEQIRRGEFHKEYLAVLHGVPDREEDTLRDLLLRNKQEKKTYITSSNGKDVQEAILSYRTLGVVEGLSKVRIQLQTGRTHQIRAQFSGRGLPLVGDQKYGDLRDTCEIALWSYRLAFTHPKTGEQMEFVLEPPRDYPWTLF